MSSRVIDSRRGLLRRAARALAGALLVRPRLGFASSRAREASAAGAQTGADGRKQFSIHAKRYAFEPNRLEVDLHDLVKIELVAEDIPHSFALEAYRILKRVRPGDTASFEFLADRAGTFPFYCSLTIDEGCRRMRGELVVRSR
ncbi:MAG: cupredoxin domain-containing protein [Vicinamibacterales bacterium]